MWYRPAPSATPWSSRTLFSLARTYPKSSSSMSTMISRSAICWSLWAHLWWSSLLPVWFTGKKQVNRKKIISNVKWYLPRVGPQCPRLLINLEKAGEANAGGLDYLSRLLSGTMGEGLVFDTDEAYRDVALLGTCDDGCKKLADALGWKVLLFLIVDYISFSKRIGF